MVPNQEARESLNNGRCSERFFKSCFSSSESLNGLGVVFELASQRDPDLQNLRRDVLELFAGQPYGLGPRPHGLWIEGLADLQPEAVVRTQLDEARLVPRQQAARAVSACGLLKA